MRHFVWLLILSCGIFVSCGESYEVQKRITRAERARLAKENAKALKIGVMPTLDCLPLFVARHHHLFDTLGADVRLKYFTAQMDCDTALAGGSVEGSVTDLVRASRLIKQGTPLTFKIATDAYWQLVTNRNARIKTLKQLDDKMLAMTRYSATALLADHAVDSARLKTERVFRIQVNDVLVRLQMLLTNEMDAMLLTEPQATVALQHKHRLLMDSRQMDWYPGVIALRSETLKKWERRQQVDVLVKAYNQACDSINKHGLAHYRELISRQCHIKENLVDSLPKNLTFRHAVGPRQKDIDKAEAWLKTQE